MKNKTYLTAYIFGILFILFSALNFSQDDGYAPFADEMPAPVGGYEAVYKKIVYPEIARRVGVNGKVYILVYVNESGGVDDVKLIKGIGGGCDEVAMNAIKTIKFQPGKNGGAAVKVKLSMAINFKLK